MQFALCSAFGHVHRWLEVSYLRYLRHLRMVSEAGERAVFRPPWLLALHLSSLRTGRRERGRDRKHAGADRVENRARAAACRPLGLAQSDLGDQGVAALQVTLESVHLLGEGVVLRVIHGDYRLGGQNTPDPVFDISQLVDLSRLVRYLEQNQPDLLKQLTVMRQRLDRITWQRIVVQVYTDYPEYAVESELLPQIRKTQAEQQPE